MADRSQDDINEIMAGMDAVYAEESRRAPPAPRCHLTPMQFHMGEDECWWECSHCGHTKDTTDTTKEQQ